MTDAERILKKISCSTYDIEVPLPDDAILANQVMRLKKIVATEKAAHKETQRRLECMKKSRDEAIGHMDRLQKQLDLIGS